MLPLTQMEVAGLTATHPTTEALLPTNPFAEVLLAPGLLLPVAETVIASSPPCRSSDTGSKAFGPTFVGPHWKSVITNTCPLGMANGMIAPFESTRLVIAKPSEAPVVRLTQCSPVVLCLRVTRSLACCGANCACAVCDTTSGLAARASNS